MGLALRVLGFVVFIGALAGATYGAYQAFPPETTFSAVELSTTQEGPVKVLAGAANPITLSAVNKGDAPVTITLQASAPSTWFTTDSRCVRKDMGAS